MTIGLAKSAHMQFMKGDGETKDNLGDLH